MTEAKSEPKPRVERNGDGSCIVHLSTPITCDGDKLTRVTIPALTGAHMRRCPVVGNASGEVPIGQLVDFAAHVVLPRGAIDVMNADDALLCGLEVAQMMGKSRSTGAVV